MPHKKEIQGATPMLPARWQGMGLASSSNSWSLLLCSGRGDPKWTMAGKLARNADVPVNPCAFRAGTLELFSCSEVGALDLSGLKPKAWCAVTLKLKMWGVTTDRRQSVKTMQNRRGRLSPQFSGRSTFACIPSAQTSV